MPRKIDIYEPGVWGVNVDKQPLHYDQSGRELTKAQNAEFIFEGGEGALEQRPGMTRINSSAVAGSIALAFDVPTKARSEYTEYLYAGMAAGATANWRRSTDGASWSNDTTAGKPFSTFTSVSFTKDWPKAVTVNNNLYFFDTSTPAVLYSYNGTTATAVLTLPANRITGTDAVGVMDMLTDGIYIYVALIDAVVTEPDLPGRVLRIHPKTGSIEEYRMLTFGGAAIVGAPSSLCIHNGLLFMGTYTGTGNGQTPKIYKRPIQLFPEQTLVGSGASNGGWFLDHTLTASQGNVTSLASFQGYLYAAVTSQVAGTAGLVKQRTSEGVWSTSRTGPATTVQSGYTSLWTFNSELYAGWTDPGTTTAVIEKYDGSSWASDNTLADTEVVCQAVTFPTVGTQALYVVLGKTSLAGNTASRILKRTTGGVWSTADNESDHYRGPIAILRT